MKLPLTTLLPPQVKAVIEAFKLIPWRLLMEVVMIIIIYFLWSMLGDAKTDIGKLESQKNAVKQELTDCRDGKAKLEQSQAVSDGIIADNQQADAVVDEQTRKLLKKLQEMRNACPKSVGETPSSGGSGTAGLDGLDGLLDLATCTAKQNGIPCSPRSTSAPL